MISREVLRIDAAATIERIAATIGEQVRGLLRRRGAVVGVSGGVDSAVVAALCARALGAGHVLGLLMPERRASRDSQDLGRLVTDRLGIETVVEEIGPSLEAIGCYRRQEAAIRTVFPEFQWGWPFKIALPPLLDGERLSLFSLVVARPDGRMGRVRLSAEACLRLVAATNFKQRVRAALEYYHADRLRYAVAGTPNRLEYDQGFFVKVGDGAADFKPIARLYKTQVYALAEALGIPEEVRRRPPTTDTYPLAQTQEEFYFALPWDQLDLCLWAVDHDVPAAEAAPALGLAAEQVERVYRDIAAKRRAARYLHQAPLLPDEGVGG